MLPFDLSPAAVTAMAVVLFVVLGLGLWIALRGSDDRRHDGD